MSAPETPREALGMRIARAIAPDAWAEYDHGKGRCTIESGARVLESISAAARVLDTLESEGFTIPPRESGA